MERENGEGVCGGTEERNVVQRAGVGRASDEEGRICDLIQRIFSFLRDNNLRAMTGSRVVVQ